MNRLTEIVLYIIGLLLLILFAGLLGGFIGYDKGLAHCEGLPGPDTVRIEHWDTTYIPSPPSVVTNTVTKTVKVPVHDTVHDSVWVDLPFEQRYSRLEDVADVWYSGYDAQIDSAYVYKYHTYEIVHNTTVEPAAKNMVMVTAGAKDASLSYLRRIGPVWIGAAAGYTYDGTPTVRGSLGLNF